MWNAVCEFTPDKLILAYVPHTDDNVILAKMNDWIIQ